SQARIKTIALVHERLYKSKDLSSVEFDSYLTALAWDVSAAYGAADRGISIKYHHGAVSLPLDAAIPCGLIVNELVTNALKHAFPSRQGVIHLGLRRVTDTDVELFVEDDGVGLPESWEADRASSFGLGLVFTFADQLEAAVDVRRRGGTRFAFRFAS